MGFICIVNLVRQFFFCGNSPVTTFISTLVCYHFPKVYPLKVCFCPYLVCVKISRSMMAAVVMLPVTGSILNRPLMLDDWMEYVT